MKNHIIRFSITIVLLCTSFLFNNKAAAQSTNKSSTAIKGIVKDKNDNPLPGVNVAFPQLSRGAYTDSEGRYHISDLPTGIYTLIFSFVGYESQKKEIVITKGETKIVSISLTETMLQSEAITVTGTPYASDPLTTPADVDVLTGDTKFAKQQTSLGSSLEELSGVSSISTGSQTGKPVIRGLSGSRVRVLDDGVAMDYQQYGVRHGPNVDPFTSERIEVVRGAASVQYGSDALGGAVNVISNSLPDAIDAQPFLQGQTLGEFSSNNDELAGGLHLDGATGRWGFTSTIIRRVSGNMTTPDVSSNSVSAPKFSGELDHTDYEQLNGSFGIGYQTKIGQLTAEYTRWQNNHNFLLPNGKGLGQNLENNSLQIEGNLQLGNNFILKPSFTYSTNLRQSNAGGANAQPRSELPDQGFAHLDILLKSYTAKTELEHPKVGPFSGTAGLEYKYQDQQTRGIEPLVPSAEIQNIAGFVFEKAKFGDLTLSVGARADVRSQTAAANSDLNLPDYSAGETTDVLEQSYFEFSGSLGGTYQITNTFAIAANVGRGFRAPNLFNLHVDGVHGGIAAYQVGNPHLDSEHSLNTDLSLRWRSSRVKAKASVYRNTINNYIFLVNTGQSAGPNNGGLPILETVQGDARLLGADANISAQVFSWLQLSGTFETVDGKNVDNNISQVDTLPLLPPTKLSGTVKFVQNEIGNFQNTFVSVGIKHSLSKEAAGRYEPFWQFGNTPFGVASTDAYTLFNATVGGEIALWSRPVSLQISAQNILDKSYRDFLNTYKGYTLSAGRNITFRIKVPFTIL
ncbi:iron complex outermembrane recepter protein/hemoglobin/transferrin/lactoferrin receptor protein [Fodinibius salinus]|uniref:Iron complex outermembrane recepter protein/hemoglobin/transferrin/lactoferrin receptor protein n=1 Tax=Fodinibius salinus TaxID=860790 RepID=A0A5D3YSI5_9BACT|nr:TonB-dependent receptor [Fodinibius salinus]TYP95521.1 iron complex outermembrane recepter protein/hemoglobin/transferrin/lactoferrin receptor protein [Fodinibius salinus]